MSNKTGSIRQRILGTSLVPALILGGLWVFNVAVIERKADETAAQELVGQNIESVAQRLSDISMVTGNDLGDNQMKVNFGQRARELQRDSDLPLTSIAATDGKGNLTAYYAMSQQKGVTDGEEDEQFVSPEEITRSVRELRSNNPEIAEALQLAASRVKASNSEAKTVTVRDGDKLLVAVPVTGSGSVLVGQIDNAYIAQRARDGILRSLLSIVPAMIACLVLGTLLANSIIGRLSRLSAAVGRAANGEEEVVIPIEGNDEVTLLARDAERLHAGYRNMVAMNEEL